MCQRFPRRFRVCGVCCYANFSWRRGPRPTRRFSYALSPSLHGDNAPHPTSVAAPATIKVALEKAALDTTLPALPVRRGSVERPTVARSQAPSAVCVSFRLACRRGPIAHKFRLCRRLRLCFLRLLTSSCRPFVVGVLFVPGPPSPSRRYRKASGSRGCWFRSPIRIFLHQSSKQPAPTARKPRPPRTISSSEVCLRPSIDSVPIAPI